MRPLYRSRSRRQLARSRNGGVGRDRVSTKGGYNKKLSYCLETARRESLRKTAEITFRCPSRLSEAAPFES